MQPTDVQVERSLDYLRTTAQTRREALEAALHQARNGPEPGLGPDAPEHSGSADPDVARAELPPGLLEQIEQSPDVRDDRLAEARSRFNAGDQPDADTLAARMVGRLVCDRLR